MRVISSSEVHGWASIREVHVYGPATATPAPAATPTPNPSPAPTPCARVDANQPVAYIANNTGTPNYSNVSLSPVEMVP